MNEQLKAAEQECQRLGGTMQGRMVMTAIGPLVGMLFELLRTMVGNINGQRAAILQMADEIEKLKRG